MDWVQHAVYEIAWDLAEEGRDEVSKTKAAHALRRAAEQARRLFEIFYAEEDEDMPAHRHARISAQPEADREDMRRRAAAIRDLAA